MTVAALSAENRIADLEEQVNSLQRTLDTLLQNGLNPLLITPGTLRFGGNRMQLDHDGMQVKASAIPATTAVYFVNKLIPTPGTSYPRGQLNGYAIASPAAGLAELQALASSTYYARVYAYTGTATNPEIGMYITDGTNTVTAELIVSTSEVNGRFVLDNATLRLASFSGADPTTVADGDLWYRSDTDVIRARINGATVSLPTSTLTTLLLTDTAWAAKGDLVAGTANDTAAILSYPATTGYFLQSDTTTATGMVWASLMILSNQTGNFTANRTFLYRCSGTITATLEDSPADGSVVAFKNVGTGTVTVARGGTNTIFTMASGQTSFTILPGEAYQLHYYSAGTEWLVL